MPAAWWRGARPARVDLACVFPDGGGRAQGATRNISPGRHVGAGVFVVPVHVLDGSKQVIGTDVFTVGPGTASDGRVGQLVITDVQPA